MLLSLSKNLATKNLALVASLLLLCSLNFGCVDNGPGVAQQKVHRSKSGLDALRKPKKPSLSQHGTAPAAKTKNRMVVAVFDNPDATWFFKLNGPLKQVDAAQEQWQTFFDSIKFEDDQPKWDAPQSWSKAGPKPMRFATLLIDGEDEKSKPLELAVSSLGPGQNMLLNVNRWRGQLGLGKFTADQLETQLKTKKSEHGEYLLFDAQGTGSGTMRAPFAGGAAPPFAGGATPMGMAPGMGPGMADSALKFTAPQGWTTGKTSSMVQARFSKTAGEAKAQITVIEMPAATNHWKPNVERWAGQVGLSELSDQRLAELTSEIEVDQIDGKLVDLVADSKSENGVIAAMVKRQGSAWFFKLSGEKELVDQSREEFETFIESIRYQ